MKRNHLSLFVLAATVLVGGLFFMMQKTAQAQIPNSYKVGNWCWAGGEWGDGRCNAPETESERDWMWDTGFYLGQYYLGNLTCEEIPLYVQIIVGCRYGGGEAGTIQQIETPNGVVVVQAVVDPCSGVATWVVVFTGSPSGATANQTWGADNFIVASDSTGDPTCPHEIHGNDNPNVIVAGSGDDIIWGYGGNDTLSGGDGDDILNGGNESCIGMFCNLTGVLGDTLNGDAGNDTLNGGNESCEGDFCTTQGLVGDTLSGGEGDDVLNGGDESCTGAVCNNYGNIGDTLNGGEGDDVLNGGDESCDNDSCNAYGTMGDTLNGDAGADTLNGGDESCSGFQCNNGDTLGDTLNAGGAGNSDGDPDVLNGGGGTDTCNSTAGEGDTQTNCP